MGAKQGRRKLGYRSCRWKQYMLHFSIRKAYSIKNFYSRGPQWMRSCNLNIFQHLREPICRVWPELWTNNYWLLHQDNAPMQSTFKIHEFSAKNQVNVLDHPPYSPNLAPCDFFLCRKIKNTLKSHRFQKRGLWYVVSQTTAHGESTCFFIFLNFS